MENQLRKLIRETIELDINIGDEILGGRFKNKKTIVKDIGKNDKNQPTINGKEILKFRIKKLIKEEIRKLFEILDFQADSAEQIATNSSLFKLPRKGIDDTINNYNQAKYFMSKYESGDEDGEKKEEELNKFSPPELSPAGAPVSTNIYESDKEIKKVQENFNDNNIYDGTAAAMQNLDWERPVSPRTANFGKDSQDEFDLYNDNIDMALKEIPAGNSREGGISNNKSKNF